MKAFIIDRYKSRDGGWLGDMPEPQVRDDRRGRVGGGPCRRLECAGFQDPGWRIQLVLPCQPTCREILGNDVAGVVVRVGRSVRRLKLCDDVNARPHQNRIGTLAEFIVMHESDVAVKPKNLTTAAAASIRLVG
jgi:NADPH:quinone reductase-like Zn-dependent oxidoreductase